MSKTGYYRHETSFVDDGAEIGEGTRIWHFSHVLAGARVGRNCVIGQNVCIERGAVIGDGCKIQNNVSIYTGVTLEEGVFCGPSCVFTNVYNPRAFIERKHEYRQTLVKKGATIGANATIVCGATIGCYALVAAGALVRENVPDYAVVAGMSARRTGWACKCGTTLKAANDQDAPFTCAYCGNEYILADGSLRPLKEIDDYSNNRNGRIHAP